MRRDATVGMSRMKRTFDCEWDTRAIPPGKHTHHSSTLSLSLSFFLPSFGDFFYVVADDFLFFSATEICFSAWLFFFYFRPQRKNLDECVIMQKERRRRPRHLHQRSTFFRDAFPNGSQDARFFGWKFWFAYVKYFLQDIVIHSNLHLARVSVVAYAKWRLSFNVSECKQSGPYELLSTVRLTQVNALHADFSMSGNECERCALLLTLM